MFVSASILNVVVGSIRYIHESCLRKWRSTTTNPANIYRCDVCHYEYRTNRLFLANFIRMPLFKPAVILLAVGSSLVCISYVEQVLHVWIRYVTLRHAAARFLLPQQPPHHSLSSSSSSSSNPSLSIKDQLFLLSLSRPPSPPSSSSMSSSSSSLSQSSTFTVNSTPSRHYMSEGRKVVSSVSFIRVLLQDWRWLPRVSTVCHAVSILGVSSLLFEFLFGQRAVVRSLVNGLLNSLNNELEWTDGNSSSSLTSGAALGVLVVSGLIMFVAQLWMQLDKLADRLLARISDTILEVEETPQPQHIHTHSTTTTTLPTPPATPSPSTFPSSSSSSSSS